MTAPTPVQHASEFTIPAAPGVAAGSGSRGFDTPQASAPVRGTTQASGQPIAVSMRLPARAR